MTDLTQRQPIVSAGAPKPVGPYSQAILSGDFVFVSGNVGFDPNSGTLGDSIEAQTRQTLQNIGAILAEAGCSFSDVVKSSCFITEAANFAAFNEVYREFFAQPYPARSTIVCNLALKGLLVEIEVIARRPARGD